MQDIFDKFNDFYQNIVAEMFEPRFLLILASFAASIIVLTVIKVILNKVIGKRAVKSRELIKMFANMIYLVLLFVLISVHFSDSNLLNTVVFKIVESDITILVLMIAAFVVIFAVKLSSFIQKYVLPKAYEKYEIDKGTRFTFSRIFHYVILVLAILISLNVIGINITSLTVFASIFGVGLGFGMQNVVSNFISGIIILFERPIKVGDRVVVDGILGEVMEIKIRATVVKTVDNEHIIVPNSYFLEQRIINRSYGDLKIRITIDVGVSYSSDVDLVRRLLLESVENVRLKTGNVLTDPEPQVMFTSFGESSLDFKLLVWVDAPPNTYNVKSELHFDILRLFRENSVEIPFPQRDVHMRTDQ